MQIKYSDTIDSIRPNVAHNILVSAPILPLSTIHTVPTPAELIAHRTCFAQHSTLDVANDFGCESQPGRVRVHTCPTTTDSYHIRIRIRNRNPHPEMPPPPQAPLQAAQALNGQLDLSLELPYADEEGEEERQQLLAGVEEAKPQLIRKPSLGQRRNVEQLPLLRVVNELPNEYMEMSTPETSPESPPAAKERETFSHGMRRNSISLPSGINSMDLDALRRRHQMHPAQDALHEESHNESVSCNLAIFVRLPGVNDQWETSLKPHQIYSTIFVIRLFALHR